MAVRRGLDPSPELICEIVDSVGQEIIYLSGKSQRKSGNFNTGGSFSIVL